MKLDSCMENFEWIQDSYAFIRHFQISIYLRLLPLSCFEVSLFLFGCTNSYQPLVYNWDSISRTSHDGFSVLFFVGLGGWGWCYFYAKKPVSVRVRQGCKTFKRSPCERTLKCSRAALPKAKVVLEQLLYTCLQVK